MSTARRSKAMPTDGPTAKFLYTIIKQLDLKSIDWNLVASQLEISNGHAARMRFSRFKQQMEGTTSTPRVSKPKKNSKHNIDKGNPKADLQRPPISPPLAPVKQETPYDPLQSPYIKTDPYLQKIPTLEDIEPVPSPMVLGTPQSMATSPVYHQYHQLPHQHRLPQPHPFPFTPYPQYHPQMAVAPADLTMRAAVTPLSPPVMGFEMPPTGHPVWAPVKREPEAVEGTSNGLVKMEGS